MPETLKLKPFDGPILRMIRSHNCDNHSDQVAQSLMLKEGVVVKALCSECVQADPQFKWDNVWAEEILS